jgi:hypothetical protein
MMDLNSVAETPVPLDWDAEGSVAMVVMPQVAPNTPPWDLCAASDDYWHPGAYWRSDNMRNAIVNTLESNLADRIIAGEITEEELLLIADLLFDAFDAGVWRLYHEVTHVAQGGAERLTNVYFDSVPPNGAMAQAGPDSDIVVLGEFGFHTITASEASSSGGWVTAGERVVVDISSNAVSRRAQLAIGWFTK